LTINPHPERGDTVGYNRPPPFYGEEGRKVRWYKLLFVSLYIMCDMLYHFRMAKLIRECYRFKQHEVMYEDFGNRYKIIYEIVNCRIEYGYNFPQVKFYIKINSYYMECESGWVKISQKPLRREINHINNSIRNKVFFDKYKELGMFGIDYREYSIVVENVIWKLI
jgi:hypothetical protein